MKSFWLWLSKFAWRRFLKGDPTRKPPVGVPYMRDPENTCSGYEPRLYQLGDWRDCQSDGHYLCKGCCHLDPVSENAEWFGIAPADGDAAGREGVGHA